MLLYPSRKEYYFYFSLQQAVVSGEEHLGPARIYLPFQDRAFPSHLLQDLQDESVLFSAPQGRWLEAVLFL